MTFQRQSVWLIECYVFTKRPGRIKSEHIVTLNANGCNPLACRESPEFSRYYTKIWKELNSDG